MQKPTIFISHINEEKDIANALKDFLETKFLGIANVFASCHEDSLQLGDRWLDRIHTSMKDCQLLIILCSPISTTRPWINFEAGAGWIQGVPVIPLCHSGMELSKLPIPINSFQAGILSNPEDARKLFKRIAKDLGIHEPKIEDNEFFSKIKDYESKIENSQLKRDTEFIKNTLLGDINKLAYNMLSCTHNEEERINKLNGAADYDYKIIMDLHFPFNKLYNMYLRSAYSVNDDIKVYQMVAKTAETISAQIKFLLTYSSIKMPPFVKQLFHKWLENVAKYDLFLIEITDYHTTDFDFIKNFPPQPDNTYRLSFADHAFVMQYDFLHSTQQWIKDLTDEINRILAT